jgi:hypothetical protein
MSASSGEDYIRKFKLDKMAELKRKNVKEQSQERVRGRSSFFSIPPPKLDNIYRQITTVQKFSKEELDEQKKKEDLATQLCNAYRFVVNYGVFEANFEWMPNEVKRFGCL